jgi:hypothetical protein
MNRPAGTEKLHSWKATNDTTNPLGGATQTRRQGPSTQRRRRVEEVGPPQRDRGATRGKHWSAYSSTSQQRGLGRAGSARAVVLQMQKNSKSKGHTREEEEDGKAKSRTSARHVILKGRTRPLTFNTGPVVSARLSPTRAPWRNNRPLTRRLGSCEIRTCRVYVWS